MSLATWTVIVLVRWQGLRVQVMDMMGFEPSHWNKINIHIGGVYGDKLATLDRFAQNFERLSANCKARLTLENDDWPCAFAVKDLLPLSRKCSIPIVFDFHHHKFCSGGCAPACASLLPYFHVLGASK